MARPLKSGLDYFPHDTDMSDDQKILCLEAEHGLIGYAVFLKLLERIYKTSDGKLSLSSDTDIKVLSKRIGISSKKFMEILKSCVNFSLFDTDTYNSQKVITSSGINRRLSSAKQERERKRNWRLERDIIDVDNAGISTDKGGIIDTENTVDNERYSTTKESRVKEIKGNKTKEEEIREIVVAYESNIGQGTPSILEKVKVVVDEYPPKWVTEAIGKAATMEHRSWAYVEGILRGWKRDGYNPNNGHKDVKDPDWD